MADTGRGLLFSSPTISYLYKLNHKLYKFVKFHNRPPNCGLLGFSRFHIYSTISHLLIIMVNKNYVRGANIEYKIKKDLESKGFFCIRSAGSHSCVDLACITPSQIMIIQVKRSKKPITTTFMEHYYDEDIKKLRELTLPDNCIRYLYFWVDRHGLQKYKILPDRLELV